MILGSLTGNNCSKNIDWAVYLGSVPWPHPFKGHWHSKHVLGGGGGSVTRKGGEACLEGLFPPWLNRTAVAVEKQNLAYLSGYGHA